LFALLAQVFPAKIVPSNYLLRRARKGFDMAEIGAPNNVGTGNTQVDTESMAALVKTFTTAAEGFNGVLVTLNSTVEQIVTVDWKGDAGPAMFRQLHEDWSKQFINIDGIIDVLAQNIGSHSESYRELDQAAGAANQVIGF